MQSRGIGGVFRVIPEQMPELEDLDLPRGIRRILDWGNGLVLFTGPTGCGKSTTQAALIHEINRTRACHIITVEDPIEFVHKPIRAVLTQRQVGKHVRSFHDALRSALREAPDVLLVGEMRDLETIQLAISAAETGVLVFGTLHTGSAAQSIDRIVDAFAEDQAEQIRGVLSVLMRAVVSQRLVRLASGDGQCAAIELLFNTVAVANLIREQKSYQLDALLQSIDPATGMQSLDRALVRLVKERRITVDEALSYARFPQVFVKMVEDELREEAAVLV
jgi:twitching motility protein PilT